MRKWIHIFLLLLLPVVAQVCAAEEGAGTNKLWFSVGEKLTYRIYWGVIPIGSSVVSTEWIDENGRKLIAIRFRTRTTDFMTKVYPVDDFLESVIDPETFLPLRFVKRLSEGKYRCDELTTFDHAKRKSVWTSKMNGKVKEFDIDADTRDIITFMYFMRSEKLLPKTTTNFRVMSDERVYDLVVKAGEIEKFRVSDFGWVKSLRLEPEAAFQGVFVRKGKVTMWISNDERRICTKMAARVPVASVSLLLTKVEGPGDDFWTRGGHKDEE